MPNHCPVRRIERRASVGKRLVLTIHQTFRFHCDEHLLLIRGALRPQKLLPFLESAEAVRGMDGIHVHEEPERGVGFYRDLGPAGGVSRLAAKQCRKSGEERPVFLFHGYSRMPESIN